MDILMSVRKHWIDLIKSGEKNAQKEKIFRRRKSSTFE